MMSQSTTASALPKPPKPFGVPAAILWGTLIAGALDATDGVVFYGFKGLNPIQVLQFIASGVLGTASYQGGLATAGLGTLLHFFIAAVVAALYVTASRKIPQLLSAAIPLGLLYGATVYLFMTYLVVPFSAIGSSAFSLVAFLNGIIGHALFVGLPIALLARKVNA
jgi:uncharacterized membrane protein YagU involved in acid resistance